MTFILFIFLANANTFLNICIILDIDMNDDYDHNVVDVFLHTNHDEEDIIQ